MSTPTTQSNTRITAASTITITTITLTLTTITITIATPTVAFSDVDQISISLLKSTLRVLEAV